MIHRSIRRKDRGEWKVRPTRLFFGHGIPNSFGGAEIFLLCRFEYGVTHIFYSGHNADFTPVEAVMHATASDATLSDFTKIPEDTFSGTDGYSDFDFRDPKVFWNEDTGNYWMLITSRYNGEAAIGLYTSDDLLSWTPQAPLSQ